MRLPHALREPRSEGTLSEDRMDPIGKSPDLAHAVAPRDADEDRLVIAAGEEFDLTTADQVGEVPDDVRSVRLEPIKKGTGEVKAGLHLGVPVKRGHERGVRPLGHILEH
jgi:hypothetical protein